MEDSFLIRQVLGGNREAFRFLVLRYQRPLLAFLGGFRLETQAREDLAQEAFLRAYRNLEEFDADRSSFASWLFVIARNQALNELAKHSRASEIAEKDEDDSAYERAADDAPAADVQLDDGIRKKKLGAALQGLPLSFRSAVTLSYLKELSLEEIARIERCSVGTVKSRVFRGKKLLRLALRNGEES
jgi:RNA polymerase sigma-70 factor (ECF subfamily)